MKYLLMIAVAGGCVIAQDKPKAAVPEVPKLEMAEMKLAVANAQNVALKIEMLKVQYAELQREQQRLQGELETKYNAIYAKAGAKREEFDLDTQENVFRRKEAAKK